MPLNINQIKALKAPGKPMKTADGAGLYLETFPNGSKLWRQKYRIHGKEKRLALGAWPDVSLARARELSREARSRVAEGVDPSAERRKEKAKAKLSSSNTFAVLAEEYIETKMVREGMADRTVTKTRYLLGKLQAAIGNMPIDAVDPQMLLAALKKLEAAGTYETAKRCRAFASRVFRYAVITGRATYDPAAVLQGALITPKARHFAAILDPEKFGQLLRAIDGYDGHPVTQYALKVAPHVFVRPGELRQADWNEINLEEAIWTIPAAKMKARKPHAVPLSRQVIASLKELHDLTGPDGFIFPSIRSWKRPMSDNTLNAAFRRMGFPKDEVTAHGLRSTASTLLNESGRWDPDAIERALAHGDSNAVRGAYHRGTYWKERVKMAQWWSDYLDSLKAKLHGR